MPRLLVIDPERVTRFERVRVDVPSLRHGPLQVTMTPEGMYIGPRGAKPRDAFLLPYGVAYMKAAQLHGDKQRAEKAARRKARHSSRVRS